jgi:hypothetical protein
MFAVGLRRPVGWQPSRFLADRAGAERAFALAEQLGSVNAAATQLGTTWPPLRKAFTRHGLGMPAPTPGRPPTRHRRRPPAHWPASPTDHAAAGPGLCGAQPRSTPTPRGPQPEQGVRLRRAEDIETLSYRAVVVLNQEAGSPPRWHIATITGRVQWSCAHCCQATVPTGRTWPPSTQPTGSPPTRRPWTTLPAAAAR